ncbi:MAG: virulence RhuM family protein [Campylobacterales bacterium]|nr:virulence RhuM family protein [Campylobacterales bacterium]
MDNVVVFDDGELELKVSANKETVWLNRNQLSELFDRDVKTIGKHINNVFKEKELVKNAVVANFATTASDGKNYNTEHYNLDVIISVGYRVKSQNGVRFRQWATSVLKNYIQNGFAINEHKITEQRLSSLESDVANIKSHIKSNSLDLKQGIFYNGQIFDAYVFISDLIKNTKKSVILIDNYVDESVLTLFSKNQNIEVTIYTTMSKQLKLDTEKYNKQYKKIEVKIAKNFHDRFLILDKKDVYHIGASLKDLGNKVFAFSKIEIDSEDILKRLE